MPFITLTVKKPKTSEFKTIVLNAVHTALVTSGVPAADRFQRVLELSDDDFRYDASYPDVKGARNENFVMIEILWSVGRSVKVKKGVLATIMNELRAANFDPENVMVCFKETAWENWAFAGGRIIHAE